MTVSTCVTGVGDQEEEEDGEDDCVDVGVVVVDDDSVVGVGDVVGEV